MSVFFVSFSDEEPVVEISNEDQNAVVPVVGVNRELDFSNQVIVPLGSHTCHSVGFFL